MKEEAKVNYAFALKNYQQNGRGRSMKKFCEEEGYDYEKFIQYSRRGQKEYSVLKDADARQTSDKFIPLVVDGLAESVLGVLVREHNRFELTQIRIDAGKFFKPIMDESRRFGKICWSDLVMLTEASVCGNIRIKYVD